MPVALGAIGSTFEDVPASPTNTASVTLGPGDVPAGGSSDIIVFVAMAQGRAFTTGIGATGGLASATTGSEFVLAGSLQRVVTMFYIDRASWSGATFTVVFGGTSPPASLKVVPFIVTGATGVAYTVTSSADNKVEDPTAGPTYQQPPRAPASPMGVPGPSSLVLALSLSGTDPTLSTPNGFTIGFSRNINSGLEAGGLWIALATKVQAAGAVTMPVWSASRPPLFGTTSAWLALSSSANGPATRGRRGLGLIR